MASHVYRLVEQTFRVKIGTSERFQFYIWFKTIGKNKFFYKPFSFNLTMEHIQLYKFHFQNSHTYRLVEQTFGTEMATSEQFQFNT